MEEETNESSTKPRNKRVRSPGLGELFRKITLMWDWLEASGERPTSVNCLRELFCRTNHKPHSKTPVTDPQRSPETPTSSFTMYTRGAAPNTQPQYPVAVRTWDVAGEGKGWWWTFQTAKPGPREDNGQPSYSQRTKGGQTGQPKPTGPEGSWTLPQCQLHCSCLSQMTETALIPHCNPLSVHLLAASWWVEGGRRLCGSPKLSPGLSAAAGGAWSWLTGERGGTVGYETGGYSQGCGHQGTRLGDTVPDAKSLLSRDKSTWTGNALGQ